MKQALLMLCMVLPTIAMARGAEFEARYPQFYESPNLEAIVVKQAHNLPLSPKETDVLKDADADYTKFQELQKITMPVCQTKKGNQGLGIHMELRPICTAELLKTAPYTNTFQLVRSEGLGDDKPIIYHYHYSNKAREVAGKEQINILEKWNKWGGIK